MDIYVLDKNFNIIDICDDYESVIWNCKYFEIGDFELYLPATQKNINLISNDRFLVRDKDMIDDNGALIYKNVMIIKTLQITTSVEEGNHLIATGPCLKSIIARRIVWQQTLLHGSLENAIRRIVTENAINPTIAARKIPNLQLGEIKGFTDIIEKQVTGKNMAEFITEVCKTYGIGWDVVVVNGVMRFDLYKGEDRSYKQSKNSHVTFSPEFDNLLTTDYKLDKSHYKNVALVAGEGEGLNRKTVSVGTASGMDRYEMYVDSRNSSSNNGEITQENYASILTEEGLEALSDDVNSVVENIDGSIEPLGNYQLNVDYFLGDIVEVINEYGISTTPRIIEIIENEDETGTKTVPTFSTWEV